MRTVISLFSGIGGMDMGFGGRVVVHEDSVCESEFVRRRGPTPGFVELVPMPFRVVFQNDILEGAREVSRLNGETQAYDVRDVRELLADTQFTFPCAEVVVGGFPCQDFSQSGKRRGFESEARGTLYRCFAEVVRRVQPRVFVAENVAGLLTMKGDPIVQIVSDFEAIGYVVAYQLVDCSRYGIPQTRKRVIIMGVRIDEASALPPYWNVLQKNKTTCHIGKYFEHLCEPDKSDDLSQQLYSKAARLKTGQGQREVDPLSFGPTMRAEHHGNIEFRGDRRLTVREAGLIQTFPPDYVFATTHTMRSRAYKYIGNAVPPLLGYLIADHVDALFRNVLDPARKVEQTPTVVTSTDNSSIVVTTTKKLRN